MTRIYELVSGYAQCSPDWDDGYINAIEEAESKLYNKYEDVMEWLEENMEGKYKIVDDYEHRATLEVTCILSVEFVEEEDAMAFKLRWSELC